MTFEEGQQAAQAWATSSQFQQFDRDLVPEDIMVLFLPPVPQDMMQVSRPLPKPYRDWLAGFRSAISQSDD